MFGVVSQTRFFGGNRTHDPHANSLAHYPLYLLFFFLIHECLKPVCYADNVFLLLRDNSPHYIGNRAETDLNLAL